MFSASIVLAAGTRNLPQPLRISADQAGQHPSPSATRILDLASADKAERYEASAPPDLRSLATNNSTEQPTSPQIVCNVMIAITRRDNSNTS